MNNTTTAIIGIIGRAGAGKDTVADALVHRHLFTKRALADPLREMARALTGWPPAMFQDRVFKEQVDPTWGLSPRQLLQRLGTQGVRAAVGEDAWLKAFVAWRERTGARRVVVPDVRFPNEAEFLDRMGARFLVVRREQASAAEPTHVSEHMAARLDGWTVHGGAVVTHYATTVPAGRLSWTDMDKFTVSVGAPPEPPRGVLTLSTWKPWPWSREPTVLENNGTVGELMDALDRTLGDL